MSSKTWLLAGALTVALLPVAAQARTQIRAVGSSTVYPFATAVSERFARTNPRFTAPIVESTGTGAGMKLFCAGVGANFPDIENASRRMKASEFKSCKANGVAQITEVQVGMDGIALATVKSSPLKGVSQRDIYMALAANPFGKPNRAKTWRDVNAKLPPVPIRVYGPPPTSGTRDALAELLLTPPCEANPSMAALKKSDEARFKTICTKVREDGAFIESGENDNLIVQKIEANPGAIGVFGYSYLEENQDKLAGISINGIAPTYESIATFKYPGARPLYVYVKNQHARAVPGIREYLAEFSKEAAWGPKGYLVQRGMIASPGPVRQKNGAAARALTPMTGTDLK